MSIAIFLSSICLDRIVTIRPTRIRKDLCTAQSLYFYVWLGTITFIMSVCMYATEFNCPNWKIADKRPTLYRRYNCIPDTELLSTERQTRWGPRCHTHSLTRTPVMRSFHVFTRICGWFGSRLVSVLDSGAERPGFESQPRRWRVTVLGKLFTPIVPPFTKHAAKLVAALLGVATVTVGLAESNGSL